jgi:hypothetical protein
MQLNETRDPTVHDGLSISGCRDILVLIAIKQGYQIVMRSMTSVDCKSVVAAWSGGRDDSSSSIVH